MTLTTEHGGLKAEREVGVIHTNIVGVLWINDQMKEAEGGAQWCPESIHLSLEGVRLLLVSEVAQTESRTAR